MIERVDNVGIAVRSYATSAPWYEQVGFDREDWDDHSGSFRAGAAVLYIFESDLREAPRPRHLDLIHNPPGIDHISFRVPDVDLAFAALTEGGVAVEEGPTNQEWGSRTITLLDPDGNRLYLLGPLTE